MYGNRILLEICHAAKPSASNFWNYLLPILAGEIPCRLVLSKGISEKMSGPTPDTLVTWISIAGLLLIFLVIPVALVLWELATGHIRNSVTGRRRRWHFHLKTMFVAVASLGTLLTIWRNFEAPAAAGITVALFVGGPLFYLFVGDLFRRGKAARHTLGPDKTSIDKQVVQQSFEEVSEQHSSASAEPSPSSSSLDKKWWTRRWAAVQFGRFGIWK
ncbi:MAG: hypothetical protein KDA47_06695 [Planctomycetales bacterium]|nr:hypothetical protein [Planctomycetales bacterium]